MADPDAHKLAREIREPGSWSRLGGGVPGSAAPWMVVPTLQARYAVGLYHRQGRAAADAYIARSRLTQWRSSPNPGIVTNVARVRDGLAWYFNREARNPRAHVALDAMSIVPLPSGDVPTRVDVVLENADSSLSGEAIFWDGPDFRDSEAATIAAVFAQALRQLYPSRNIRDVEVIQGRHTHAAVVRAGTALDDLNIASTFRARM